MIPATKLEMYKKKVIEALSNSSPTVTLRQLEEMTGLSRETIRKTVIEGKIDFSFGSRGATKGYTQAYRDEITKLKELLANSQDAFTGMVSTATQLAAENSQLKSKIDCLQIELEIAKRPWWKRLFS